MQQLPTTYRCCTGGHKFSHAHTSLYSHAIQSLTTAQNLTTRQCNRHPSLDFRYNSCATSPSTSSTLFLTYKIASWQNLQHLMAALRHLLHLLCGSYALVHKRLRHLESSLLNRHDRGRKHSAPITPNHAGDPHLPHMAFKPFHLLGCNLSRLHTLYRCTRL